MLELHPKFLGKEIMRTIKLQLDSEVEGTSIEGVGFIVAVVSVMVSRPGWARGARTSWSSCRKTTFQWGRWTP
jgi:hypothetical protein